MNRLRDLSDPARDDVTPPRRRSIVPPYLLSRIAEIDDPRFTGAAEAARRSLLHDGPFREPRRSDVRPVLPHREARPGASRGVVHRVISDAESAEVLPGRTVRVEGEPPTSDVAVNEAYDGLGDTYELFWNAFGRDSIDDAGLALDATVHFGRDYDNAFWDGERMVFGDGDGEVFQRFTLSLSVIGHELAHGVTERTANLRYEGQSGALNEHVSDVFGALVEQYTLRQTAEEASWLIGAGLFTAEVEGAALRSMKAPGTAYDDDVLGRDPQPAHMDDFIVTTDDNGGVHLNSGIPNRAFCLAAIEIGGPAWERAGLIWYDALTSGELAVDADFERFAAVSIGAAEARYGADSREARAVVSGWTSVGIAVSGARGGE
ncbi:M4 family metallopeptidase [Agromyces atrinae]|uniref:Neutral metalloproteinase n=1 Tax=Agromyces atrinae TaxID=592376 RepID=A0A4Q2M8G0_9MICO|nr:M4 family metallopeptidase [Agromyces atrinae]NYD65811.1 Zn-dependent metalloprotease [Agromyces atrinae]RXZ86162.1 peptidase M4 family protein [Agromyces atrinae]